MDSLYFLRRKNKNEKMHFVSTNMEDFEWEDEDLEVEDVFDVEVSEE